MLRRLLPVARSPSCCLPLTAIRLALSLRFSSAQFTQPKAQTQAVPTSSQPPPAAPQQPKQEQKVPPQTQTAESNQQQAPQTQQGDQPQEHEKPLWMNCDTVEEIIEEEKFGSSDDSGETEPPPPVQPEHVALALRAFVWGTVYAILGVGLIALIGMRVCGFTGVSHVLEWIGTADKRRVQELRQQGVDVVEYQLDLTKPSEVPQQLTDLWAQILQLSGADEEIDKAIKQEVEQQQSQQKAEPKQAE